MGAGGGWFGLFWASSWALRAFWALTTSDWLGTVTFLALRVRVLIVSSIANLFAVLIGGVGLGV